MRKYPGASGIVYPKTEEELRSILYGGTCEYLAPSTQRDS